MFLKSFLHKLKEDLKVIFYCPEIDWGDNGCLDYDKYWARRKGKNLANISSWQKQRAELVLPYLGEGDVVVDVGGGGGEMLDYWSKFKKIEGICADFNELALSQAGNKGLRTMPIDLSKVENWQNIPPCDFLTGFEILEHLPNPEEFILSMKGKVRKGMFFSFPNTGYYTHRLRLLFGLFPLQWVIHPGEHLRFWTARDVFVWVKALGFKSHKVIIYEGLPLFNKIWPSLFGQGLIVFLSSDNEK